MSIFIASINSGSNANCYYIGNKNEAVLIDAGLSCRETVKRIKRLGLDMQKVKAVFISHEHADHISGIATLHKRFRLPVYITPGTLANSNLVLQPDLILPFQKNKPIGIGNLRVTPFFKSHDANDPHSFMISSNGLHVGVITDIGHASGQVINCFRQCHAVFLEANYCENMLAKGQYPPALKKRISSDKGHLSNTQALELFLKHKSEKLQLLILSHLSKNNNTPELVKELFTKHAGNVKIVIAGRYSETNVFAITHDENTPVQGVKKPTRKHENQLSLF
ncbi:MAG: MBL fold metallo-hydrolase [Chitinophagales bacterium]